MSGKSAMERGDIARRLCKFAARVQGTGRPPAVSSREPVIRLLLALFLLPACVDDVDGDGVPADRDCDDQDRARSPDTPEACNGLDDDCDGLVPADELDQDGDGLSACDGGCDDTNHRVSPDEAERCDGLDNDCDGEVDEEFVDSDGNGVLDCMEVDADGDGFLPWQGDCDDSDPLSYPGATELCDGQDNDCDGYADADPLLEADSDGDGSFTCADCDDNDGANEPGGVEACDGRDNDCDGEVDEGLEAIWYRDEDDDGHGRPDEILSICLPPGGWVEIGDDCDDAEALRFPGNPEVCDGLDNDCDGVVDEGVLLAWYPDDDGDGFGTEADVVFACAAPEGWSSLQTDCDDSRPAVHPGAAELCDRLDTDCNGVVPLPELDGDLDDQTPCEGDCDDTAVTTHPGAEDVCNGVDDDCDGLIDAASTDELCPPGFGVDVTECVPGTPPGCAIVSCEEGYWDFTPSYDDGCECEDDAGAPTCGDALDLGPLQPGDALTLALTLPDPAASDWFRVQFPAGLRPGLGEPSIALTGNPGDAYRFDLHRDCAEGPAGCPEDGSLAESLTSWSQRDDQSDAAGYLLNDVPWPEEVWIRVDRSTPGLFCEDYTLEITR